MRPRRERRGELERNWRHALRLVASMRPRRERRGELNVERLAGLTWPRLQCGHGASAVENEIAALEAAIAKAASMRPRRERRGELQHRRQQLRAAPASMRPRRERRGEPVGVPRPASPRPPLQCGHGASAVENKSSSPASATRAGFNAATARAPWRTKLGKAYFFNTGMLQCGHGAD